MSACFSDWTLHRRMSFVSPNFLLLWSTTVSGGEAFTA